MNTRLLVFSFLSILLFGVTFGGSFLGSALNGGTLLANKLGAQVGISVGVNPNEFTNIAKQVTEKQEELDAREASLVEREKSLGRREEVASIFSLEWYVTILAFILLLLVLLNFYLDWRRDNYFPQVEI